MKIRCIVAYDGTRYLGWQKTEAGPSIEGAIETALQQIMQHPIQLNAASRTDAGVHARGQVLTFSTDKLCDLEKLRKGANALLPSDITILSMAETSPDFHPTLHCQHKEYTYDFCFTETQSPFHRFFSWHFPYSVDHNAIRQACSKLIGTRDFATFCNERKLWTKDTVRTILACTWEALEPHRYRLTVRGNNFLYRMVRNLAGTLVYIGSGKIALEELETIMEEKNRTLAGVTAPAHGLTLNRVAYGELS